MNWKNKLLYLGSKLENQNQYFIDDLDIYNSRLIIFWTYYVTKILFNPSLQYLQFNHTVPVEQSLDFCWIHITII